MYLPLNINLNDYEREAIVPENKLTNLNIVEKTGDVAKKLKMLLQEAGVPSIDENLLLQGLLSGNTSFEPEVNLNVSAKTQPIDLIQSENDFIDAYNALTRSSPLPNINENNTNTEISNGNNALQNDIKEQTTKTIRSNNMKPETPNQNENHQIFKVEQLPEVQQINNVPLKNEQAHHNLVNSDNELGPPINSQTDSPVSNLENQNSNNSNISETNGKVKKSEKNISDSRNHRQIEEKSNNLTDIVDNTQRLIQQMKEEINSDINSIDGRTISQSEAESSSDETNDEQESSYSDTEERTDNLTSDEKEVTSSEDEDPSEKRQALKDITSSEENDNFEEALDHVENQLEDFKHANIEMLNSIARTLQEEHTFTIEVNEPRTHDLIRPSKKEDVNNNVFRSVNSFEEIYEELSNTHNNVNVDQIRVIDNEKTVKTNTKESSTSKNVELFAKETIILTTMKPMASTKLVISENIQPVFNAILETVEQIQDNNSIDTKDTETQEEVLSESITINMNTQPDLDQEEPNENNYSDNDSNQILLVKEPQPPLPADSQNTPLEILIIEENIRNNVTAVEENPPDPEQVDSANKDKKITPSQSSVDTPSDTNSIKNSIANKSNIPKLIRIIPNNKPKNDNSPKLIVSKVPVRRTSLKQYPAPAPPKSHFGNIRSGHVKQLQTRLFNNKAIPSQSTSTKSEMPEVKPTTSTLSKKKPAPLPPLKQKEEKQLSPPKTTTPLKEKKPFFRETCRTEDEWTDSDSDDSQLIIIKPTEEPIRSPPSPPPPITVRRVSGNIIDLAKVRLPEGSPEVSSDT